MSGKPALPETAQRQDYARIVRLYVMDHENRLNALTLDRLGNYSNDAAASAGGVAVGGFYRNGSVLMVRVA